VDNAGSARKFHQAGISDKAMLCEACEARFSDYDRHGVEVIREVPIPQLSMRNLVPGGESAFVGMKADYALFKLFALAMLWRASVSSLGF